MEWILLGLYTEIPILHYLGKQFAFFLLVSLFSQEVLGLSTSANQLNARGYIRAAR